MTEFFNDDLLLNLGFSKETDNIFFKLMGKNIIDEDVKFYIEYKPSWSTEMGFCFEFKENNDTLLLAYCLDEKDFLSVISLFNV